MKNMLYVFSGLIIILTLSGCETKMAESTFECFDSKGNKDSITLTYKVNSDGDKTFYDGDKEIGGRYDALQYAKEKTGMTCHSGTDRK